MKPIFLTVIIFLSISPLEIQCNNDLINQICKQTPFFNLCISSLNSGPSTPTMDIGGLACTMSNILLSNATDTLNFIESQIKQASDPQTERALAYCAELYIPVVNYNLPQAIEALSKEQYAFAAYGISDAAKQADACDKNVSKTKSAISTMTEKNKMVHCLSDVAAAIVKLLLKG